MVGLKSSKSRIAMAESRIIHNLLRRCASDSREVFVIVRLGGNGYSSVLLDNACTRLLFKAIWWMLLLCVWEDGDFMVLWSLKALKAYRSVSFLRKWESEKILCGETSRSRPMNRTGIESRQSSYDWEVCKTSQLRSRCESLIRSTT